MCIRDSTFICRREGRWREGSNNVVIGEVNTPGTQGDGVWPRPSVCVMAIGDCPVHSFLVVIEMPALQPEHSFEINATTYCCQVHICRREGRGREGRNSVVIERGQHTRHSRTRGLPTPSVCVMVIGARFYCPVHSFIVVIEMRALSPAHSLLL